MDLRKVRKTAGLTLKEASARSGLSFSFISELERGLVSPTLKTLERLAAVYGYRVTLEKHDGPQNL